MLFTDRIRRFCIFCSQGFHPEIFSLIGFTYPDLPCNGPMLMTERKAVVHLGIVGAEPAYLALGRASADGAHGADHGTVLHQALF